MDLENKIDRSRIISEFAEVINRNSLEQGSNTPDFIIAEYLVHHLQLLNEYTKQRREWYAKYSMPENQSQANRDQHKWQK